MGPEQAVSVIRLQAIQSPFARSSLRGAERHQRHQHQLATYSLFITSSGVASVIIFIAVILVKKRVITS